ncbi:MAG: hypothetical protein WDZ72_13905 [Cyclobacteriaceae bacterium]
MYNKIRLWPLLLLLFTSCGVINIRKSGGSAELYSNYSEDLSDTRIRFEELPDPTLPEENAKEVAPVDQELAKALQRTREENHRNQFFNGFTILIYSGVDRELAFETRNDIYSEFPEIQTNMEYVQPRYLVKVGKFINRIEALAMYEKVIEHFPSARIVPDKILKSKEEKKQEENIGDAAR